MTTKDMLYACDVKVKNITKSEEIDIKTTDWLVFLNQGQEETFRTIIPLNASTETQFDLSPMSRNNLAALIKDKQYVPAESKSYVNNKMTGSTYTFEYPSDLKYIDYAEVVLTPFGDTGRVYKGTFTSSLFYPISGQIAISRTGLDSSGFIPSYESSNTVMRMEEVRVEDAIKFIASPLNKNTIFLYPKYWIEGGGTNSNGVLKVVIDTYSTLGTFTTIESQPNIVFTYIKTPTEISVDGGTTSNLPDNLHEAILKKAVEERNKSLINNSNKN